jgi:hypothetical protein
MVQNPPGKNLKRNFLQPTRLSPTPANSTQKGGEGDITDIIYVYYCIYISHYKTATLSYKYVQYNNVRINENKIHIE